MVGSYLKMDKVSESIRMALYCAAHMCCNLVNHSRASRVGLGRIEHRF